MKPLAEAAPPATTPPATAELFAHEWDEAGICRNAEHFSLDGMPPQTAATFNLGMGPDNQWRVSFYLVKGTASLGTLTVTLDDNPRETRAKALTFGLTTARDFFKKDRRALKVLAAVAAKVDGEQVRDGSPANKADETPVPAPEPAEIATAAIEDNPRNERERPAEYIAELAEDIARNGLLQRVAVVLLPPAGDSLPGVPPAPRYRLLYGGCRLKAVRSLQWPTVRAEVYPVDLSPRHESRLIKAENLKRRNPNPVEEAQGYADHMAEFGLTQEEMAKEVGKSRPVIANALRVLDLPAGVRELLGAGALTAAHGTALCRFKEWPAVCAKIAELAVKQKTPAGELEKNLPFGEELVDAKLAVDLFPSWEIGSEERAAAMKNFKDTAGFFVWRDKEQYEDFGFCLDLARGKEVVAEMLVKSKARAERERNSYAGESAKRDKSGELTPAAKRERQKKLDGNLANRLGCDAVQHAAIRRARAIGTVDAAAVAIVVRETLRHAGGYGWEDTLEDLAKTLGIAVPKKFDDECLEDLGKLGIPDMLRLAAAAVASREYGESMRYAHAAPDDCLALAAMPDDLDQGTKLVEQWKELIRPLVGEGRTVEEIVKQLDCPEFLATQLRRVIRRELREAKETPAPKAAATVPEKSKELKKAKARVEKLEKKVAGAKASKSARAIITDATRYEVKKLVEAGKTGAEIAKAVGISLPSVQNIKKALGLVRRVA